MLLHLYFQASISNALLLLIRVLLHLIQHRCERLYLPLLELALHALIVSIDVAQLLLSHFLNKLKKVLARFLNEFSHLLVVGGQHGLAPVSLLHERVNLCFT